MFDTVNFITSIQSGIAITTIQSSVFEYHKEIISVSIPDSVKRIGDRAFYECRSLKNVVIPEGFNLFFEHNR